MNRELFNNAEPNKQGWMVDVIIKDGKWPTAHYTNDLFDLTNTEVVLWNPFWCSREDEGSFHRITLDRVVFIRDHMTGEILQRYSWAAPAAERLLSEHRSHHQRLRDRTHD